MEVGGEFYTCHRKGQHLEILGSLNDWKINGSLICPSCEEFCGVHKGCPQEMKSSSEGIAFVEGERPNRRNNAHSFRTSTSELIYFIISRVFLIFTVMGCFVPSFHFLDIFV